MSASTSTTVGSDPTVVGNTDLALRLGNQVYDNAYMVSTRGQCAGQRQQRARPVGHERRRHLPVRRDGLSERGVRQSRGFETYASGASTLEANRVFHNSAEGMLVSGSDTVRENVVYSTRWGSRRSTIRTRSRTISSTGTRSRDLIYSSYGGLAVVNNTVYQEIGDAVRLTNNSQNVKLATTSCGSRRATTTTSPRQSGGFAVTTTTLHDRRRQVAYWQGNSALP